MIAVKTTQRESSIELLRIVAMFLILVQHANFLAIGIPSSQECLITPFSAWFRFFIESVSIVAVNVFIVISGWFGIKASTKKLVSLLFQVLFFTLSILLCFGFAQGWDAISAKSVLQALMLTKCYWFVKSYLCLFILSPVLNLFAETVSKSIFRWVLIGFFLILIVYGWTDSAPEFFYGYSVVSFIGLYLLARYLRLYPIKVMSSIPVNLVCFFLLAIVLSCASFFLRKNNLSPEHAMSLAYSYINPLIIAGSFALFFVFQNLHFHSRVINWISASAFSVYIIHINGFIFHYFQDAVWFLYSNNSSIASFFLITLFLVLVFVGCVLLDKIRILAWSYVSSLRCK